MIFLRINLPNFVQLKQYQSKSGPRHTTRYFVQRKIFFQFSLGPTVNINSSNIDMVP